jgi:hypothetical protein
VCPCLSVTGTYLLPMLDGIGGSGGGGGGSGISKMSTVFEYPLLLLLQPPPKNILFVDEGGPTPRAPYAILCGLRPFF